MKSLRPTALLLITLVSSLAHTQDPTTAAKPTVPSTRADNVQDVLHGVTIPDLYRWLEDQKSPETRAWITEQNAYTHSLLDTLPGRNALQARLAELKKIDGIHSPFERSGRFIYGHRRADQEQYAICLRQGENGKEEVLIDPNPMSAEHTTNVEIADVSKDGKLLAYMLRAGGKDETEIHLLDLDTRHELPDVLPLALYFDVGFLPDNSGFYYSIMTDDGPRVRFHKIGSPVASDADVFGEGYSKEAIVVGDPTPDGRHLVITVCNGSACDKAEIWLQDLSTHGAIEPLVNSPYQHVTQGTKYPAVLFMSGDGDTRVAPLHARKMAALLQTSTGSDRPIMLRYELAAGHAGGRSVTQDIGDSTDILSFLFWQLKVGP